ncbi:Acyltransferase [Acetobacteraceae bacterium AT-5844]|nr:Acyltransferase [Acetobacteraceae bacterium AT-5844]
MPMEWQFRPARDTELSPVARLRSHSREVGLAGAVMQGIWRRGVRRYLQLFHKLEVVGRENLPATTPFVLISNHASHLDAMSLGAVLRGPAARRAFALAAGDVFFGSVRSSAFAAWAVNALPVWRKRTSAKDLNGLRERLEEDGLVFILFPEGTRSRSGEMGRFLPGIGALVAGGPVPVVPCYLEGAYSCWPASRRLPRPGKLRLTIGTPLEFSGVANDKAGWMEIARRCEQAVRALQPVG